MRFANQSRLSTLIHPRLSAPVHSLRKRDNSMSLAHQTRGISAITHTERSGFESSGLSSIDPSHDAFWDFFGESWFTRKEYEARASFFLFEISHWDHFHPHRTLPVPPWTSSLEILEFWKVFKWSSCQPRKITDPPNQPPLILGGQISFCTILNSISWPEIITNLD